MMMLYPVLLPSSERKNVTRYMIPFALSTTWLITKSPDESKPCAVHSDVYVVSKIPVLLVCDIAAPFTQPYDVNDVFTALPLVLFICAKIPLWLLTLNVYDPTETSVSSATLNDVLLANGVFDWMPAELTVA